MIMLEINFSFTDEFGQTSSLNKTLTDDSLDGTSQFDLLVEEFKCFLLGSGFNQTLVDSITVIE